MSLMSYLHRGLLPHAHTILLSSHDLSAAELAASWGGTPAWIALPDPPRTPISGIQYATLGQVGEVVQRERLRHAILNVPFWQWRPRMFLQLHRQGLHWCWGPWGVVSTRTLAYLRGGMILACRWGNRLLRTSSAKGKGTCQRLLQACPLPQGNAGTLTCSSKLRIMHYLRQCALGGTERQVALLAGAQRQAGHVVSVRAQMVSLGEKQTCHPWFTESGIALRVAGSAGNHIDNCGYRRLRQLPGELSDTVAQLLDELRTHRPDVLHCWGDEPNIAGFIAARLARVPAVVQSTTGMSPNSYPATLRPWMQPWYQAGLGQPNVALACISNAGVEDYTSWLRVPTARLDLLRIAVAPQSVPTRDDGQEWRHRQGIAADAPVLTGFFRLEPGKRPLMFLDIVQQVKRVIPHLHVLLMGGGSLETQVRERIRLEGLENTVQQLGQPTDVLTPLAASDVLLLVSEAEGTPVSVLEAQLAGCVPVMTDVGGSRETVPAELSELVRPRNDVAGLARVVIALLRDSERRQRLAALGRHFVLERFSLQRMADEAQRIYSRLLLTLPSPSRLAA